MTDKQKPENPPAFPIVIKGGYAHNDDVEPGMTLRDYFAGQAMQSLLSDDEGGHYQDRAERAYSMADYMLKARQQ